MSAPRSAASATSGAINAMFSDLSARAENWTHAARIWLMSESLPAGAGPHPRPATA